MPDSLKNLLTSVDWSRMASRPDVRNALVGSALGGALLGGASLMGDHDPEESKLAPVGDALTGALLGGIAGYGVPKGLELFRNSGTLAPANDQIPNSNYLGAAAKGGLLGAGTIGASIPGVYGYHALRMINAANDADRVKDWSAASAIKANKLLSRVQQDLTAGRAGSAKHYMSRAAYQKVLQTAFDAGLFPAPDSAYGKLVASLEAAAAKTGRGSNPKAAQKMLDALKTVRRMRRYGFTSFGDLTKNIIGDAAAAQNKGQRYMPPRLFRDLLFGQGKGVFSGRGHEYLRTLFSGARYGGPGLFGKHPLARMALRAGKWGAGGAALATALHALLGPSAKDNFKN